MILQETKNEIAFGHGYDSWNECLDSFIVQGSVQDLMNLVAIRYAQHKWDEACNDCIKQIQLMYKQSNIDGMTLISDTTFLGLRPEFKIDDNSGYRLSERGYFEYYENIKCGYCGKNLELVRPGKHQCNNERCKINTTEKD